MTDRALRPVGYEDAAVPIAYDCLRPDSGAERCRGTAGPPGHGHDASAARWTDGQGGTGPRSEGRPVDITGQQEKHRKADGCEAEPAGPGPPEGVFG